MIPEAMLTAAVLAFTIPTATLRLNESREFPRNREEVWVYEGFRLGKAVDQAVVSWNVKNGENADLRIEIRPRYGDETPGSWLPIADWTLDESRAERRSFPTVRGDAFVDTDTLMLKRPSDLFDLRLVTRTLGDGPTPKLTSLTITGSMGKMIEGPLNNVPNVPLIEVPQRAQGDYPDGGVLCSPTSVSMVLNHYGARSAREELGMDMPVVQAGVYDPEYDGCGNWSFNAAYGGSFDGLKADIVRFEATKDLVPWLRAGVPVIVSVSLDLLMGREKDRNSGHLVVLLGFDKNGDPIMNDPARRGQVRQVYKRADFERAWAHSRHTTYLIRREDVTDPNLPQAVGRRQDDVGALTIVSAPK